MAVAGYDIASINAEFPQHAWAKDLGQLGSLIIGRPHGQTIWISEFYGRSNIILYQPNFPAYPTYDTIQLSFNTVHGVFHYLASSHEWNGNNNQTLNLSQNPGGLPWSKFIRCEIPWMGYSLDVNWWAAQGYSFGWGSGNFSGGPMNFYFYG